MVKKMDNDNIIHNGEVIGNNHLLLAEANLVPNGLKHDDEHDNKRP